MDDDVLGASHRNETWRSNPSARIVDQSTKGNAIDWVHRVINVTNKSTIMNQLAS